MRDFEKLGVFYLGKRYDLEAKKATDEVVLYDSKDLVTHALCVGMTGSGKTGLGIAVIEEAAIDGVPVLVIDPKGDLTNLLLTFPDLRPDDFAPWVNEDDARRAGKAPAAFAADQAGMWQKGLAAWGEDGARIQRLRDAAEFTIYTPGSTSGVPVSVLRSFAAPPSAILEDDDLMRERLHTTVSSVLALAGIEADPVKGREHILLSTIVQAAWRAGQSLDLATLVQRVQQPSIQRVGVIDLESFFPAKERFAFAMAINTLIAAPGFEAWTRGEALDIAAMLRSPSGKPRVSIFSLAHLDDAHRMFFVSLLLNQTIGWMRGQAGTSSLRAVLYMDEIFGFFPPIANPPSKQPLLTLLKQARAFGLGVVLATQNPVDLDYKGLSNIGTWWLGRLQTERDKARVLDGLEGASSGSGFDRAEVDRLLSALTARVFVMRNVHEDGLTVLQSRWALSYLRGPLSRDEIKRLTAGGGGVAPTAAPGTPSAPGAPVAINALPRRAQAPASSSTDRPVLPPDVRQYFSPTASASIEPVVYGAADVRFVDPKGGVDLMRSMAWVAEVTDAPVPLDWQNATPTDLSADLLLSSAPAGAVFAPVPASATRARNYDAWTKQLAAWIAATASVEILKSPSTGETSKPEESERDFRARLQQAAREQRDEAVETLRRKYAPKQAVLDEKLRRAKQAVERESQQATAQKLQTAISVGATLVGALLGRKAVSASTIGRATTAARGVGRSVRESEDIQRARETVAAIDEQRQQLDDELKADTAALDATADAAVEKLERIAIKPKKTNVTVKLCALLWT